MGPDKNDDDIDQVSLNQFTDDFFKPWYKAATGTEDEQVGDGEDPIIEVEKIIAIEVQVKSKGTLLNGKAVMLRLMSLQITLLGGLNETFFLFFTNKCTQSIKIHLRNKTSAAVLA